MLQHTMMCQTILCLQLCDNCSKIAQSQIYKEMFFSQFTEKELDWPAQSPELNPIQHFYELV